MFRGIVTYVCYATLLLGIIYCALSLQGCGGISKPVPVCLHPDIDDRATLAFIRALDTIEDKTCDIFKPLHMWKVCDRRESLVLLSRPYCRSGMAGGGPMRARIPDASCDDSWDSMIKLAMHEVIHTLGVGHSPDPDSIMHGEIGAGEFDKDTINKIKDRWCDE